MSDRTKSEITRDELVQMFGWIKNDIGPENVRRFTELLDALLRKERRKAAKRAFSQALVLASAHLDAAAKVNDGITATALRAHAKSVLALKPSMKAR